MNSSINNLRKIIQKITNKINIYDIIVKQSYGPNYCELCANTGAYIVFISDNKLELIVTIFTNPEEQDPKSFSVYLYSENITIDKIIEKIQFQELVYPVINS